MQGDKSPKLVEVFWLFSSSKSLYVNIIGFFSRHREEPQGFVVYDPIELKHSNIEDGKDYSIIWLLILILIIFSLIYFAIWKYRKARQRSRERDYELSSY